MNYFFEPIKNYATFRGYATRKEFWMYQLFYLLFSIIVSLLDRFLLAGSGFLVFLYSWGLLLPSLGILVRRLHDSGHSGLWFFISFIPFAGWIWLLTLLCLDSDNNYY